MAEAKQETMKARGADTLASARHGQEARPQEQATQGYRKLDSREVNDLNAARAWRALNPRIWADWVAAALDAAKQERRFSIQHLMEQTRAHDHVNDVGGDVVTNNTHAPIFARMIATEHPETRPFIELRQSRFDKYFDIGQVVDDG